VKVWRARIIAGVSALALLGGCALTQPAETEPALAQQTTTTPTYSPAIMLPDPTPTPTATTPTTTPTPTPTVTPTTVEVAADVDCTVAKCIALTIDDGPSERSGKVLDTLKKYNVKATFFLVGNRIGNYTAAVKRMGAEGHSVQNHSYSHPEFWYMSSAQIKSQLTKTSKLIKKYTGTAPTMYRPPYGESNKTVRKVGKNLGLAQVLWDIDPKDWKDRDADTVAKRVIKNAKPGSIILTHGLYSSTIKAYKKFIPELQAKGYVFVTVDQLFPKGMKAGTNYACQAAPKCREPA
jgi:peptidoglycan/xylan/chitin deacetylase (PgdA/CDA1 family)